MPRKHDDAGPAVRDQEYELVSVDDLKLHPRNPNQSDLGLLTTSIESHGFYGAVIVQRSSGFILAGNHRYMAALHAGISEVPTIWVDCTDAQAERILLMDNRSTRAGANDESQLAELLTELAMTPEGLSGTGYDGDDLDELIQMLNADGSTGGQKEETRKHFNVAVRCRDADDQQATLQRLLADGFDAKIR